MNFSKNEIRLHFGLERPIRILHLTDIHLSLADDIDGDKMKSHAAGRRKTFFDEAGYPERDPVGYLQDAMEYSREFDCTVITGDMIDFTSHANCEMARTLLDGYDYIFCAGNHEFCPKVGIPDSFERKALILDDIQSIFRGNMVFESRIVGGVNLIAMDNSCFVWTEEQFEKLKAEVLRGLPCIVFCHTPLNFHHMKHEPHHNDLVPTEEVTKFTLMVNEYITNEPMIKAVVAGHTHFSASEPLGDKTEYTTGGLFKGIVGEIIID